MGSIARKWRTYVFLLGGAFTVSLTSTPANLQARTLRGHATRSATLTVSISPNGSVPSHTPCHFTASVSGGSGNYHYAWTVNNSAIGSDSQTVVYTNSGSSFRIDVTVTDGNTGDQGYDSNIMSIGGTCF